VENLFGLAMDIGEKMLISGAEVHRVEEAIKKMCLSFGATRVDVFIITSSMVVTVFDDMGKTYTQTRRITTQTTDFLTATLQSGILHSITGMENAFTRLSQTQSSLALPVNKDS
jgi:uncharacterized membrane protein YjjP (DUF1212 family)